MDRTDARRGALTGLSTQRRPCGRCTSPSRVSSTSAIGVPLFLLKRFVAVVFSRVGDVFTNGIEVGFGNGECPVLLLTLCHEFFSD